MMAECSIPELYILHTLARAQMMDMFAIYLLVTHPLKHVGNTDEFTGVINNVEKI